MQHFFQIQILFKLKYQPIKWLLTRSSWKPQRRNTQYMRASMANGRAIEIASTTQHRLFLSSWMPRNHKISFMFFWLVFVCSCFRTVYMNFACLFEMVRYLCAHVVVECGLYGFMSSKKEKSISWSMLHFSCIFACKLWVYLIFHEWLVAINKWCERWFIVHADMWTQCRLLFFIC